MLSLRFKAYNKLSHSLAVLLVSPFEGILAYRLVSRLKIIYFI